jgi:hypothetical protein
MKTRVQAGSNTSTVVLRVVGGEEKGSLESETVKYGRESHRTRTRELLRWRGLAAIVNDRPVLWSEREPHINKPVTVCNKICSYAPDGCFIPRQTGRLTVRRYIRLRRQFRSVEPRLEESQS